MRERSPLLPWEPNHPTGWAHLNLSDPPENGLLPTDALVPDAFAFALVRATLGRADALIPAMSTPWYAAKRADILRAWIPEGTTLDGVLVAALTMHRALDD